MYQIKYIYPDNKKYPNIYYYYENERLLYIVYTCTLVPDAGHVQRISGPRLRVIRSGFLYILSALRFFLAFLGRFQSM